MLSEVDKTVYFFSVGDGIRSANRGSWSGLNGYRIARGRPAQLGCDINLFVQECTLRPEW